MAKHRKTTGTGVRYVRCSTLKERDELMGYAVRRGASCVSVRLDDELLVALFPGRYVASMSAVHPGSVEVSVERFRRMVREVFPSKAVLARREAAADRATLEAAEAVAAEGLRREFAERAAARKAAKARKPSQLDRIEATISKVHEELISVRSIAHHARTAARVNTGKLDLMLSGATFMQELNKAKEEPQPESLAPGDYTDASKETADALTAMGFEWDDVDRYEYPYILCGWYGPGAMRNTGIPSDTNHTHLDHATFLRRAAVTAKEIGLVPVVEEWEPTVGDYVVHTMDPANTVGIIYDGIGSSSGHKACVKTAHGAAIWKHSEIRPATDAEIAAHLAEQEARANAEKLAKLKAMKPGTPIKVKGKKQCTFIALERECLVWYAHYEDESYYAALTGASDITVIEQP